MKTFCGICHGLKANHVRVTPDIPKGAQCDGIKAGFERAPCGTKGKSGDSVDKWKGVIEKMRDKYGCPVPQDNATVKAMARYLAGLSDKDDKDDKDDYDD